MTRIWRLAMPLLAAGGMSGGTLQAQDWVFHHENVLGTSLELRIAANDEAAARWAEAAVLTEIDRLNQVFSTYSPDSEFSRWQRTAGTSRSVSPDLLEVLEASERWQNASGGAFQPAAQTATQLWERGARNGRMPADDELQAAVRAMRLPAWRLDAVAHTATRLNDAPLSLNAIAKGHIVDRCCRVACDSSRGVTGLLLAIGGDMRAAGTMSREVQIVDPRCPQENSPPLSVVSLHGKALATSGGYRRGVTLEGKLRSHVIDPRTARPAEDVLGASVLAPKAMDADALATIACVLEPQETLRLAAKFDGVECLILDRHGMLHRSLGWPAASTQPPVPLAAAPAIAKDQPAGGDFEMLVAFEINNPEAARYHRPYVAVWIENADGFPVRTLVLWVKTGGSGPTWVPDLRRWYRGDLKRVQNDRTDFVATRSGATRPPGKYEVLWDGKDDRGAAVKPGEYMLGIEAAREHGSYKLIRKKFSHGGEPFQEKLEGNVEIKSAVVDYRRKP